MIDTEIISAVGFPICVCAYLLYERTKTTEKLIGVINKNTEVIRELKTVMHCYMKNDKQ